MLFFHLQYRLWAENSAWHSKHNQDSADRCHLGEQKFPTACFSGDVMMLWGAFCLFVVVSFHYLLVLIVSTFYGFYSQLPWLHKENQDVDLFIQQISKSISKSNQFSKEEENPVQGRLIWNTCLFCCNLSFIGFWSSCVIQLNTLLIICMEPAEPVIREFWMKLHQPVNLSLLSDGQTVHR